jgi:hypothetical protein
VFQGAAALVFSLFPFRALRLGGSFFALKEPAMLPDVLIRLIHLLLTLASVQQIDDYPLYTMRYYGDYSQDIAVIEALSAQTFALPATAEASPAWGCSLFAAFADPANALYARNFDWNFSPAMLLYADPPDGYASVSMVDIAYLGFSSPTAARSITDLPLTERAALIYAPLWPFDGMNEHGLVIGMAAVPDAGMPNDPARETLGSLGIMREVLDHARTVDEAVAIFQQYNIDMEGGPTLHYLIADATGRSVLIEFAGGEMIVQPNAQSWDMATNFIRATARRAPESMCWRYHTISTQMSESGGQLSPEDALDLLSRVAQPNTQRSIVYNMATGEIRVAMHGDYDHTHTLYFSLAAPAEAR